MITSRKGEKYKLKLIHSPSEKRENQLEEIAQWVGFLNENLAVPLPSVHPTSAGELTFKLDIEKSIKTGTLYHWVDWPILEQYETTSLRKLGPQGFEPMANVALFEVKLGSKLLLDSAQAFPEPDKIVQ